MEIQLQLEIVHYMHFENGLIYTTRTICIYILHSRDWLPLREKKQDIAKTITDTNKLNKLFPWVFFLVPVLPPNPIYIDAQSFAFEFLQKAAVYSLVP